MSYLVLARKYRPQTFEDVISQQHVTTTLKNAIAASRVAHAILFAGPRGTGKTTLARILAKALNCEKGPTDTPCNTCASCTDITSGHAADVFEIDGASNNSVDQIRDLRETVKYAPTRSPNKIYIIDEVHMLSIAAFNALLKTLEEPPPHVLFFFATTEPHKIPITILSRCQRHDLRRVDITTLAAHLMNICAAEKREVAPEAIELVAREAGGSVRDSLSLLDQLLSATPGPVTHDHAAELLGVMDRKQIFDAAAALIRGDAPLLLDSIAALHAGGHDFRAFHADLIAHFRHLLVAKMAPDRPDLIDTPAHEHQALQEQAAAVSGPWLAAIVDLLIAETSRVRFSASPRFAMETLFLKLLQKPRAESVSGLIKRLDKMMAGDGPAPDKPVQSPQPNWQTPPPKLPEQYAAAPPQSVPPHPASRPAPAQTPSQEPPPAEYPQRMPAPSPPYSESVPMPTQGPPLPPAPPSLPKDAPPEAIWNAVRQQLSNAHPALAACLGKCTLKKMANQSIELEITGTRFDLSRIQDDKQQALIKAALTPYIGEPITLTVIGKTGTQDTRIQKKRQEDQMRQEAEHHPIVQKALRELGGRILNITVFKPKENEV